MVREDVVKPGDSGGEGQAFQPQEDNAGVRLEVLKDESAEVPIVGDLDTPLPMGNREDGRVVE